MHPAHWRPKNTVDIDHLNLYISNFKQHDQFCFAVWYAGLRNPWIQKCSHPHVLSPLSQEGWTTSSWWEYLTTQRSQSPHQKPSNPWAPVGSQGSQAWVKPQLLGQPGEGGLCRRPHPALQTKRIRKDVPPHRQPPSYPPGPFTGWVSQSGSRSSSKHQVGDGFLAIPWQGQAGPVNPTFLSFRQRRTYSLPPPSKWWAEARWHLAWVCVSTCVSPCPAAQTTPCSLLHT